jgi:hypothetical protein
MSGFLIANDSVISTHDLLYIKRHDKESCLVVWKDKHTTYLPISVMQQFCDQLREKETILELKKRIELLEAQLLYMPGGAAQVGLEKDFKNRAEELKK